MKQIVISSETHNWYMYTTWETETPNLWFTLMASQWVDGRSQYFAYLGTYVLFVEQPVVSLSLCNSVAGEGWVGMAYAILPLPFENVCQE